MNQMDSSNSGVHQLPSDCYPPTDSDDDSFVVLERSLPPESIAPSEMSHLEILSPQVIDESLELASDVLNSATLTGNLPAAPALPQVDFNKLDVLSSIGTSVCSELSPDEIQSKVESLISDNYNLKIKLQQNNMAMQTQYDKLTKWREDVEKVHEMHKQKFVGAKTYIEELKMEIIRLTNIVQKFSLGVVNDDDATNDLAQEMEKLKIDQDEKNKENELKQREYEDKINKLKEALQNAEIKEQQYLKRIKCISESKIEDEVKKQMEALRNAELLLETKEENCAKMRETLRRAESNFDNKEQKYLEQITDLKCLNEKLMSNLGNAEEIDTLKKQLMAAQFCVTELKESKKVIETEEKMNRNRLTKCETIIANLQNDADRNMALEEQLNVYKTDYESELESKNKIMTEKNKLAEDLYHIQRRNEELLEEVENLRSKSTFIEVSNSGQRSSASASAPPQTAPPSPPQSTYICPLCLAKFRSYRTLEEHVESCINNA